MKSDVLISRLKQLLNLLDKLEFTAEQNRKQLAEARLLIAHVARTVYFAEKSAGKTAPRKQKVARHKKRV